MRATDCLKADLNLPPDAVSIVPTRGISLDGMVTYEDGRTEKRPYIYFQALGHALFCDYCNEILDPGEDMRLFYVLSGMLLSEARSITENTGCCCGGSCGCGDGGCGCEERNG